MAYPRVAGPLAGACGSQYSGYVLGAAKRSERAIPHSGYILGAATRSERAIPLIALTVRDIAFGATGDFVTGVVFRCERFFAEGGFNSERALRSKEFCACQACVFF